MSCIIHQELKDIAKEMGYNNEKSLQEQTKESLISYINTKLHLAQIKSKDYIFNHVVNEYLKNKKVKENEDAPGVKGARK